MNIILIFEVDRSDIETIERIHNYTLTAEPIADHAVANGELLAVYPTLTEFDKIEDVINDELEW